MNGLYVYGLAAAGSLPEGEALGAGLAGASLGWVQGGGLAALTSPAPEGELDATRRNMLAHTAVLERAMQAAPLLPVRFGTVAPAAPILADCLARNAPSLSAALDTIAGRVELGVKASWRPDIAFAQLLADDAGLRRMRDRLRGRPPEETQAERIALGRQVEAALQARREADAAALLAQLSPLAEREVELSLLDERMILNRAFLVRRDREEAFDAAMAALAGREAERIEFRYVGPVPPYNFVSLQAGLFGRG
ncbi:GvpL/GvpF family gas vesicle protein [Roseomonas sp. GC11]|uniref:GvpL/GvpF family gas vesicle protein n=1 Tax=Roseomonas sp. GC11 TaxID=2950546 RepID=UPI002108CB15|nr:GvpL/GvpF family gas vesicle protein [Roseomonas sp. GC11]MCQ4161675.1 GvpL/GvpF family gas vesicle protein [Roseomonas sp. GC11]